MKSAQAIPLFFLLQLKNGVPKGIRTPVTAVKGRCPRPLDDGDPMMPLSFITTQDFCIRSAFLQVYFYDSYFCSSYLNNFVASARTQMELSGVEPLTSCMPYKRSPS